MVTPTTKQPGKRSAISQRRWEQAFYDYHVLDVSARELGRQLKRDHSTVIRKFQGMVRREPGLLGRLVRNQDKNAPPGSGAGRHTTEGRCADDTQNTKEVA